MTDPLKPPSYDQASAPPPPPPPYEWGGPPGFLATPVPAAATPPRRSRWRWVVALLATVVVIVAGVGIAVFAQNSRSSVSIGPTFLPANTVVFADARLDLPGDQREKLTGFLSHFPGFADQASFDLKVNQTFDRWVGDATQGKLTYTGSVAPWFSGQVALGMPTVPGASTTSSAAPRLVAGFGVKDRARLEATIASVRALAEAGAAGATFSDEDYNGSTLVTVKTGGNTWIYAVTDTVFLIATDASDLKQSIDLLASPAGSLAKDPAFSAGVAQLPADRLGTVYASLAGLTGLMPQAQAVNPFPQCGDPTALLKGTEFGALVAQGGDVALDFLWKSGSPGPSLSSSDDLAARMPADTQVYLAMPDVGTAVHNLISCLKPQISAAIPAESLKQVETTLGSTLEDYFSFVGDAAIGGSYDGTKLHAGLVATIADETLAATRIDKLVTLLRLASSAGGLAITVTDAKVGDITVTTIDFGKLQGLPASTPVDTSLSVAVGGGHLYLGTGDFAAAAIARQKADSLAGTARYASALAGALANATPGGAATAGGVNLYVDVAAIKTEIESAAHVDSSYTTNVKPYLDPLDRLIEVSNSLSDGTSVRLQLFVK